MSSIVFILGAGASKQAGVPLMADFIDEARTISRFRPLGDEDREAFDMVLSAIDSLQIVHSKADLNIDNVESVFAAFEMSRTLGTTAVCGTGELDQLIAPPFYRFPSQDTGQV